MYGYDGDDVLHGDTPGQTQGGNDEIYGANGADQVYGDGGDDHELVGGEGADVVDGGPGKDTVFPDDDSTPDTYRGGAGIDKASYSYSTDPVTVSLDGAANDGVNCPQQCEGDNLMGVAGKPHRWLPTDDRLTGSAAANVINAGSGDNVVNGAGGGDILRADYGEDSLAGGIGNDALFGGYGDDSLDGGPDTDDVPRGRGHRYGTQLRDPVRDPVGTHWRLRVEHGTSMGPGSVRPAGPGLPRRARRIAFAAACSCSRPRCSAPERWEARSPR